MPEEKMVGEDIREIKINSLKLSSIYINHNTRRDILNHYYSVENGTWLCDTARNIQI